MITVLIFTSVAIILTSLIWMIIMKNKNHLFTNANQKLTIELQNIGANVEFQVAQKLNEKLNILEFYNNDQQKFLHEVFTIPSLKDFNISCRYQFLKANEYLTTDPNDNSKIIISEKGKAFLKVVYQEPVEVTQVTVVTEEHDKMFEEW